MRKIIEIYQEDLIVCDNPTCTYKVKNETGDPNADTSMFVNIDCPVCGENLLSEIDQLNFSQFLVKINAINKYFGWLSLFLGTKKIKSVTEVHIHDGFRVKRISSL